MLRISSAHGTWIFLILHLGLLDPEDEGIATLRNVGRYIPNDPVQIPQDLNLQQHLYQELKFHNVYHFYYN